MKLNGPVARLEAAQSELRSLVEIHMREGDFDSVRELTDYAAALRNLQEQMSRFESPVRDVVTGPKRGTARGGSGPREDFFEVTDTVIARTRQSRDGGTYRHEMERGKFEYAASWVSSQHAPWSTGEFISAMGADGIPQYQTYLVVAALEKAGMTKRVGKAVYAAERELPSGPELWDSLRRSLSRGLFRMNGGD